MRYERLEHTADVMVKAHGSTLKECFENAAYAMTDTMLDASRVEARDSTIIEAEGDTMEDLLYSFLSEELFIFDARRLALVEFEVELGDKKLRCRARGEPFDPAKHEPKTEIKAVTYHMLEVDVTEPSVTVLFDV
ncbi:archease [Methanomassiliicoccus luminyensis]|uniref:archease n=1 Tax=Methanomassiliicoccus luminyensis TaxID=1080712 RepID=UPI00035CCD4A|nr:archease [Methanomassiliicoccus luminyensis]